ncbi:MAG TPA: HU family DNA-binding protein [Nitrospira sp.]|nr:HU family DNA-binding protein [Nitrospira sp.]
MISASGQGFGATGWFTNTNDRRGTMTKEELIAKMAASAGITKVAAGNALQAFTGAVTSSLKKGQRVSLVNFGTFTISRRKARIGRNPRTGETLRIPAAKVPKFSAGKVLKSAVR